MCQLLFPLERSTTLTLRLLTLAVLWGLFSPTGECQSAATAWHPLPNSDQGLRYDYQRTDHMVPANPLWADSSGVLAGESVRWLHPYPAQCDTVTPAFPDHLARYYPGVPEPFGGELKTLGDTAFQLGFKDGELLLIPGAALGMPWSINATAGWTAWIDARSDTVLWGSTLDSVARIRMSTGDTIVLSKAHGILRFPSAFGNGDSVPFRLAGIAEDTSGAILGKPLPNWKRIFSFDTSTSLQFNYLNASDGSRVDATIQLYVTDVQWADDSVNVYLEGQRWATSGTDPFNADDISDSCYCLIATRWTFTRSSYTMPLQTVGPCPIHLAPNEGWHPFALNPYSWHPQDRGYAFSERRSNLAHAALGISGRSILSTGGPLPLNEVADWRNQKAPLAYLHPSDSAWAGLLFPGYLPAEYDNLGLTAMEGLGIVRYIRTFVHSNHTLSLSAYKTASDSVGVFEDLSVHAAIAGPETTILSLKTHPNPSLGVFQLSEWGTAGHLRVFDAHGQTVLERSVSPFEELDMKALAPGIYWLELSNDQVTGVAKISILKP